MEWPKQVNKNAEVNTLVSSLDFHKTFLHLFRKEGASNEMLGEGRGYIIDGVSFLPVFEKPNNWKRPEPWGICQPIQNNRRFCETFAYINDKWKIVGRRQPTLSDYLKSNMALYNVAADPSETEDVAGKNSDVYLTLKARAIEWVMNLTADYMTNCKQYTYRP